MVAPPPAGYVFSLECDYDRPTRDRGAITQISNASGSLCNASGLGGAPHYESGSGSCAAGLGGALRAPLGPVAAPLVPRCALLPAPTPRVRAPHLKGRFHPSRPRVSTLPW